MDAELEAARRREADLRRRLAGLVASRSKALEAAARLETRTGLPGADARVAEAARDHRRAAADLAVDIEQARAELRLAEGLVAELEARG